MRIDCVTSQIIAYALKKANNNFKWFELVDDNTFGNGTSFEYRLSFRYKEGFSVPTGEFQLYEAYSHYCDLFNYVNEIKCGIDMMKAFNEMEIEAVWKNIPEADKYESGVADYVQAEKKAEISELCRIFRSYDKFALIRWVKDREI